MKSAPMHLSDTMAHSDPQRRKHRWHFPGDVFVVLVILVAFGSFGKGMQIVVTIDSTCSLATDELQDLLNVSFSQNATSTIFTLDKTMMASDLLVTANDWLSNDNVTSIVDMTSDCRVTAVAAVTGISLFRTSLVSCRDVTRDVINVRPTMEFYVKAAFSFLLAVGSCLARVVLLTDHYAELSDFPKCHKGTALPVLTRVVGVWPLSKEQTTLTERWLAGVSARPSLHHMIVVGSSDFLHGIKELGWFQLLPSTSHWVIVFTDFPSCFLCPSCPPRTVLFRHSHPILGSLPLPLSQSNVTGEMFYTWQALQQAVQLEAHATPRDNRENLTSLTVDVVTGNNTIKHLGSWTVDGGLQMEESARNHLQDPTVIRVAVKESPPFAMRVTGTNGTHYVGYAMDVLEEVSHRLQFTYRFTQQREDTFGAHQANGTWSGIIGDILAGTVDLAVGPLTVTAEREAVVDFTTPFYEFAGIEILIKEISQEHDLLFFVSVFSDSMWGAWLGVLLLTGVLLAAFDYFSPSRAISCSGQNSDGGKGEGREKTNEGGGEGGGGGGGGEGGGGGGGGGGVRTAMETFDLKEGLWLVTASFTLSGPESTPRTLSSRLLVAGFWFFCSIIMANYTANLAAYLTTSRLTTRINSLQDLASQSGVRYSVVRGSQTMDYFERMATIESKLCDLWKNVTSNKQSLGDLDKSEMAVWDYPFGDTYGKIWTVMQHTGLLSSSEEGLAKVLEGNFALIDEAPYLQHAVSRHCRLTTIGKPFSIKSYAFALPQGSPLTQHISNSILQLQSEAILEKLKQKWWRVGTQGCSEVDESQGLSFYTLGGVFLQAGIGLAAGLLLCLLEAGWAGFTAWGRTKKSGTIPPINSRTDPVPDCSMANSLDNVTTQCDRHVVHLSSF